MKQEAKLYTQQELDIELLKNTNSGILGTLKRLEQKIDSNFHWTLGLTFGLYTIVITGMLTAIGKAYNFF